MTRLQKRHATREIDVRVDYGIGGSVFGRFPRDEVAGISARDLIGLVLSGPQLPGSATRTAKVLADVLLTERAIDAELTRASTGEAGGEAISLDHVVVKEDDGEQERESSGTQDLDEVTIRLSESYRGGATRWQTERCAGRE
jgi:hypothetical protein